jgi:hypothetical protein
MADIDSTDPVIPKRSAWRPVAEGIRRTGRSFQARVKVHRRTACRSFPIDTPLPEIERWRQIARGQLLDDGRFDENTSAHYRRNLLPLVEALPAIGIHPQAFVYAIQAGSFIKIGIARNPFERLADIQTAHPEDLRLVAALPCLTPRAVEGALHRLFVNRRKRGEWFALDVKLCAFLRDMRDGRITEADLLSRCEDTEMVP